MREVRRVPPNWEHPKEYPSAGYRYVPLYDGMHYEARAQKWLTDNELWIKGLYPEQTTEQKYFFNYMPPPFKEEYTAVNPEECTWYQAYEIISNGTPITPAFETKEELINYLVEKGDYLLKKHYVWNMELARAFVENEKPIFSLLIERRSLFSQMLFWLNKKQSNPPRKT